MISVVYENDVVKLVTEKGNLFEELDPRMKLLLVIVITFLTFLAPNPIVFLMNYAIIIALFCLSRLYRSAVKLFLFIFIFKILELWLPLVLSGSWGDALAFIFSFLPRVAVFFAMGSWMSAKMRIGDFVTALEQMHIPKGIIITLAVVFRYIPTVRDELYYIRNTMQLRGIGISFKNIILHPVRTMEYAMIPLILRCLTISDELAASAMTRGLDLKTKRISYRKVKITVQDIIITALIIALVIASKFMV